jgi:hypothetical protein
VKPQETAVARQWLREHIPAAMNTHAITEELLDVVFSMWSVVEANPQFLVKEKYAINSFKTSCVLVAAI